MLAIEKIRRDIVPLAKKYNIQRIDLFGSYANGSATEASDVDFLVLFNSRVPSIFAVMGFKEEASICLNLDVDVVTMPLARPEMITVDKVIPIYEQA